MFNYRYASKDRSEEKIVRTVSKVSQARAKLLRERNNEKKVNVFDKAEKRLEDS